MHTRLVTVATFSTPMEATLAKQFLESEGIEAFLADEAMALQLSLAIGGVKLQVPETDVDRARQLLEKGRADLPDSPEESSEDDE